MWIEYKLPESYYCYTKDYILNKKYLSQIF